MARPEQLPAITPQPAPRSRMQVDRTTHAEMVECGLASLRSYTERYGLA